MQLAKHRPISLTVRVVLFVAIAISFSLALITTLVLSSIQHHFLVQDTDELDLMMTSIQNVLLHDDVNPDQLEETLAHAITGHHSLYYQITDASGNLLISSNTFEVPNDIRALPYPSVINVEHLQSWSSNGKNVRGIAIEVKSSDKKYQVIAAIDMDFHNQFLIQFRSSLLLIMFGSGLFTLIAAWFGIYQGHLPLRSLSRRIREIQTNRLDTRIDPLLMPKEMHELIFSFNYMMSELERGFNSLANFSADIAHELRTPLTNLMTQIQVTLSKTREPKYYQELMYSNLEELERLTKMVGDMLWLAKIDAALVKPRLSELTLEQEITVLFDFFEALAAENNIELVLKGSASVILGDRSLLRRAMSNILSNAIRHTRAGKTITVELSHDDQGMVQVSIQNPGAEIPAEHIPQLFERFYRIDPSRQSQSDGAGLGLAITKAIINVHGGRLGVESVNGLTTFYFSLASQSKH